MLPHLSPSLPFLITHHPSGLEARPSCFWGGIHQVLSWETKHCFRVTSGEKYLRVGVLLQPLAKTFTLVWRRARSPPTTHRGPLFLPVFPPPREGTQLAGELLVQRRPPGWWRCYKGGCLPFLVDKQGLFSRASQARVTWKTIVGWHLPHLPGEPGHPTLPPICPCGVNAPPPRTSWLGLLRRHVAGWPRNTASHLEALALFFRCLMHCENKYLEKANFSRGCK